MKLVPRITATVAALVVTGVAVVRPAAPSAREPKVLEWGWRTPSPVEALEVLPAMQHRPFDGLVFTLAANGLHSFGDGKARARCFSNRNWSAEQLTAQEFGESIDALRGLDRGRFTEAFLRLNVNPGNVDWFSEDFEAVTHNAALLAKIAHDSGMNGILFDVEIYQGAPWHYLSQSRAKRGKGKTFAEYQVQVRTRGREFMRAVNAEYPGIHLLLTFGYRVAFASMKSDRDRLADQRYGLLPSFLDGLLEGADDQTEIHDGWEYSYGYKVERPFRDAVEMVRARGIEWTAVPDEYRTHYRIGFGLWMDNGGKAWNTKEVESNYFTPDEWAYSLHLARRYTDRYVWIYSHHVYPWQNRAPDAYWKAFVTARQDTVKPPPLRAAAVEQRPFGLINNGGFELGAGGDETFVAKGWRKRDPKRFRGRSDEDHAHSGGRSLRLERLTDRDLCSVYQWPAMRLGREYNLSLWVRVQPKEVGDPIKIADVLHVSSWCYAVDRFAPWSELRSDGDLADGSWHQVTATFTAPSAGTGTATYFATSPSFRGALWLDDITIRPKPKLLDARTYKGADDESTFGDLWVEYDELMTLPQTGWRFKPDPDDAGEAKRWFARDLDDAGWDTVEIRQWWEVLGYTYDGVAWYRRAVDIPESAKGRTCFLAFGAVDESAWVYVNGQLAGSHDIGEHGWDKRFLIDVSKHLKAGQPNQITVMVYDRGQYGGIWKAMKLVARKP